MIFRQDTFFDSDPSLSNKLFKTYTKWSKFPVVPNKNNKIELKLLQGELTEKAEIWSQTYKLDYYTE